MLGAVILGILAGYLGRFLMPGKDDIGSVVGVLLLLTLVRVYRHHEDHHHSAI